MNPKSNKLVGLEFGLNSNQILILVSCFLLLCLFLLVGGCAGGGGESLASYNFKEGTSELQVEVLNEDVLGQLYSGSNFKAIMSIDNQLAYDATNIVVRLEGLDTKYFALAYTEQNLDPLAGKSLTFPGGEKTILEWDGIVGNLRPGAEEYEGNYWIKIFYESRVEFSDTICINPKMYDIYSEGCEVETPKTYSGQGAPLAVEEVEEIINPNSDVEFRFKITNSGNGVVKNIKLRNSRVGPESLSCFFKESLRADRVELKKTEQETVLVCKMPLKDYRAYETVLSLDLAYDYELQELKTMRIVK